MWWLDFLVLAHTESYPTFCFSAPFPFLDFHFLQDWHTVGPRRLTAKQEAYRELRGNSFLFLYKASRSPPLPSCWIQDQIIQTVVNFKPVIPKASCSISRILLKRTFEDQDPTLERKQTLIARSESSEPLRSKFMLEGTYFVWLITSSFKLLDFYTCRAYYVTIVCQSALLLLVLFFILF